MNLFNFKRNMLIVSILVIILVIILGFFLLKTPQTVKIANEIFEELENNNGTVKLINNNIDIVALAQKEDKTDFGYIEKYKYIVKVNNVYTNKEEKLYNITISFYSLKDDSLLDEVSKIFSISSNETNQCAYIIYDANGGEKAPDSISVKKSGVYRVALQRPVRDGYEFAGWKDENGEVYKPNNKIEIKQKDIDNGMKLVLYANWGEYSIEEQEQMDKYANEPPVLIFGSNWYKGKTDKSNITKITFKDKYNPKTYTETWMANTGNSGTIKCYVIDEKELIIAGNGTGKIYANVNSSYIFGGSDNCFPNIESIEGMEIFDTRNVTNMMSMFSGCKKLKSVDVSSFDTRNVTNMANLFRDCNSLTNIDVSSFDTRNVTNMANMFDGCNEFTKLDISNFDTSKVTNMASMFNCCSKLTNIDVSKFDTKNVTNMNWMFRECNNLTNLDLSNFNTNKITTMASMFNGCKNLKILDVSSFNTKNVTDMSWLFRNCSKLEKLDVSKFNTSKATTMASMFYGCSELTEIDVSKFDTTNVTNISWMFKDCKNLAFLDFTNFDTTNVNNINNMLTGMSKLSKIKVGTKFSLIGDGTNSCKLPKPIAENIEGADGYWHTTSGKKYLPDEIPNKVDIVTTYYAVL